MIWFSSDIVRVCYKECVLKGESGNWHSINERRFSTHVMFGLSGSSHEMTRRPTIITFLISASEVFKYQDTSNHFLIFDSLQCILISRNVYWQFILSRKIYCFVIMCVIISFSPWNYCVGNSIFYSEGRTKHRSYRKTTILSTMNIVHYKVIV